MNEIKRRKIKFYLDEHESKEKIGEILTDKEGEQNGASNQ